MYSTESRVRSMNASSSEAETGLNSCRVRWWTAAMSPICSAVMPLTSSGAAVERTDGDLGVVDQLGEPGGLR